MRSSNYLKSRWLIISNEVKVFLVMLFSLFLLTVRNSLLSFLTHSTFTLIPRVAYMTTMFSIQSGIFNYLLNSEDFLRDWHLTQNDSIKRWLYVRQGIIVWLYVRQVTIVWLYLRQALIFWVGEHLLSDSMWLYVKKSIYCLTVCEVSIHCVML